MNQKSILHHVPNRAVSFNDTRSPYALVSVPKSFRQPAGIKPGTHEARVTCYQTDAIYCKVKLFPKGMVVEESGVAVLHAYTVNVSVTGSNIFVKINADIVNAMKIYKKSHCIDWTCMRTRDVFGIIRINPDHCAFSTNY